MLQFLQQLVNMGEDGQGQSNAIAMNRGDIGEIFGKLRKIAMAHATTLLDSWPILFFALYHLVQRVYTHRKRPTTSHLACPFSAGVCIGHVTSYATLSWHVPAAPCFCAAPGTAPCESEQSALRCAADQGQAVRCFQVCYVRVMQYCPSRTLAVPRRTRAVFREQDLSFPRCLATKGWPEVVGGRTWPPDGG